jgi:predicted DNA-binding transcriptional regulator AlpA
MAKEVIPVAVSTKTLCEMFGLSRQRVYELEKDPNSGFPVPSRIGRSVRHIVEAVALWFETQKGDSSFLLPKPVQKKAPAVVITMVAPIQNVHPTHKALPTVAEVSNANAKVFAATPRKGQRCVGNMIETADGVAFKHFQMFPRHRKDPKSLGFTHLVVHHQTSLTGRKHSVVLEMVNVPAPNITTSRVEQSPSIQATSNHVPSEVNPEALKRDYEIGLSLDALCQLHHVGKSRASKLLREAGAQIRKPGRSTKPSVATNAVEVKK